MKKSVFHLVGLACVLLMPLQQFAQMTDYDFAPNWTISDINGQSHTLYNYLDQNKSVVLYFFDAANPPSWSYHNTNSLQNLHTQHSDSAVVMYIEGNLQSTDANMSGSGQAAGETMGDWTLANPCPILNLSVDSLLNQYQITQFPTVITVCPGRLVRVAGQRTMPQHQALIGHCDSLATDSIDAVITKYYGPNYICNLHFNNARFRIQNKGLKPLTTATTGIYLPGTSQAFIELPWTGNLKTYETAEITFPRFDLSFAGALSLRFVEPGDAKYQNNYKYPSPGIRYYPVYDTIMNLELVTDQFGDEITWEITQSNNIVVYKGGPYEKLASPGTTVHNIPIHLVKEECYTFKIMDKYGDGMCCDYGNGYYRLTDATGLIVAEGDTSFLEDAAYISAAGLVGMDDETDFAGIAVSLHPVPATDFMTLTLHSGLRQNIQADIVNTLGQVLRSFPLESASSTIDIQALPAGTYNLQLKLPDNLYNIKFIKTE